MIGLSLSFCVKDIIQGRVAEEDVERIIAGTKCSDLDDWDTVVNGYCKMYWQDDPEAARAIVSRLLAQGKIDQPRLRGEDARNIADGWWRE